MKAIALQAGPHSWHAGHRNDLAGEDEALVHVLDGGAEALEAGWHDRPGLAQR